MSALFRTIVLLSITFEIKGGSPLNLARMIIKDTVQGFQEQALDKPYDPDSKRNVSQLISSKGYEVEEHNVVSKDGYILGIQRIPRGVKEKRSNAKKPIMLFHHGLLGSGADWVMNLANQSAGFIFADAGYDVWLANARGNLYSRKHKSMSPEELKFWNFSFDQMALIDTPAVIDYILDQTGETDLFYTGHSQGTSIAFAMLSSIPEYNKKVKAVMALGPVATVTFITSPVRLLSPFAKNLTFLLRLLGKGELNPKHALLGVWADLLCVNTPIQEMCQNMFFLFNGQEVNQLNKTRVGVYLEHYPAGTSAYNVLHMAQLQNSKNFQKFDHGRTKNMKLYGQEKPPKYDVTKITTPIALLSSANDNLADPTDVALLAPKIKNLIENYIVPFPAFSHLDFAIGMDAKKYVYDKMLRLLEAYKK